MDHLRRFVKNNPCITTGIIIVIMGILCTKSVLMFIVTFAICTTIGHKIDIELRKDLRR